MRISKNSWTFKKKKKVILVSGTVRAMLTISDRQDIDFCLHSSPFNFCFKYECPKSSFCGNVSVGKQLARPLFDSGSYITAQSNIVHI